MRTVVLKLLVGSFLAVGLVACSEPRDISDQLIVASRKNDISKVSELIDGGANVNARERVMGEGNTALFHAAAMGHTAIVELLIAKGARVNEAQGKVTPLMMAAWAGHAETANVLIDAGADVNARDDSGATALTDAARKGHTEVVRALVSHGADMTVRLADGNTALTWAKARGYTEIESILVHGGKK